MHRSNEHIEVITGTERRRRWSLEEKRALLAEAEAPGMTVSFVARKHGVSPSLLFRWRKLAESGALSAVGADEEVVPGSELRAARQRIRDLERLLGRKTMEAEILKEALEIAREKKLLSRMPLLPRDASPDER
jgi:transposase